MAMNLNDGSQHAGNDHLLKNGIILGGQAALVSVLIFAGTKKLSLAGTTISDAVRVARIFLNTSVAPKADFHIKANIHGMAIDFNVSIHVAGVFCGLSRKRKAKNA